MISGECFSSQFKVKRRDKLSLLAAMLMTASKGACKTELMYRVGLCSAQIDNYVGLLLRSELLEISTDSKKDVYRITKKGQKYISGFCDLVNLLS